MEKQMCAARTDSLSADTEHKDFSHPLRITLDSARNTHRILHNNNASTETPQKKQKKVLDQPKEKAENKTSH